jgi:hypothetical protein
MLTKQEISPHLQLRQQVDYADAPRRQQLQVGGAPQEPERTHAHRSTNAHTQTNATPRDSTKTPNPRQPMPQTNETSYQRNNAV